MLMIELPLRSSQMQEAQNAQSLVHAVHTKPHQKYARVSQNATRPHLKRVKLTRPDQKTRAVYVNSRGSRIKFRNLILA